MTADALLEDFVDLIAPKLAQRGFVRSGDPVSVPGVSADYDAQTCARFLEGAHLGDSVLERARIFFGAIAEDGEIAAPDLVAALELKGSRSLPANLTTPLKKSAWRLGIDVPWAQAETPDGTRTIWRDRDGVAARMVEAIEEERGRRGLA
jgi:hypothetical protein